MQYVDLTHIFQNGLPGFPGDPDFKMEQSLQPDGSVMGKATFGLHNGTHLDAPAHFIKGGKLISDYQPEKFFGQGILIDARGKKDIGVELLLNLNQRFDLSVPRLRSGHLSSPGEKGKVVLVHTGWDKKYHQPEYYTDYPVLTQAFAEKLVELKVKIVGLDFPSPDKQPYELHKILLSNDVLIIENLTNLERLLPYQNFEVIALPAKFAAEAAPCRVIAKIKG